MEEKEKEKEEKEKITTIEQLQEVVNIVAKDLLRKKYPYINPDWYHIEFCPRLKWISAVTCRENHVTIRLSMPPNDKEFVPTLLRCVRQVRDMREPMSVVTHALVEHSKREYKRIGYKNESDLFKYLLPVEEVEYTVKLVVTAKHYLTKETVSVESDIESSGSLKSRALMLLSHKVNKNA